MTRMSLSAAPTPEEPDRMLIYSVPGCGKSTLAASMPKPLLMPVEKVGNHITRMVSERGALLPRPESWADVLAGIAAAEKEPHDCQTFIIDTLDAAEALCWAEVCHKHKKKSIEEVGGGWQKGYIAAVDEWRILAAALERLQRVRGMRIVLLAHGARRTLKNPDGKDYDGWALSIHEKASGFLRGWCDMVLFAQWEAFTDGEGEKGKLISTGKRILRTREDGPWQAKNRHDLPPTLPLDWAALAGAMGLSNDAAQERRINSSKRS